MERKIYPVPKPEPGKKKGGAGPRKSGARVERIVAKALGGERIPGSGAIKNSNKDLTGDVEIRDADNRPMLKLEVKASGEIHTSGSKSYSLQKKTLEQMLKEATDANQLGALLIHFKGDTLDQGYTIMSTRQFQELVEMAKLGRTIMR